MSTAPSVKPAKTREIRYDLTKAQLETLAPVLTEYRALQRQINFFLDHIVRESNLPAPVVPYGLKIDQETGRPFMSGVVVIDDEESNNDGR